MSRFYLEGGYAEYIPGLGDARVDPEHGVVIYTTDLPMIADTSDADSALFFGAKSFFNGDYDFYFRNIEENSVKRGEAYPEGNYRIIWKL